MVLKQKTDPKPRVPNRCYHGTHPDRIQITFDDHRLVANAGLALLVTLARHLRLPQLVQQRLDLGYAPGRCPASTIFAGWRQSVLPVHLLGVAPLLGCVGAVAGDVKLQDDGVMDHPVDCRGGGHGVGEDAFPLREDQV